MFLIFLGEVFLFQRFGRGAYFGDGSGRRALKLKKKMSILVPQVYVRYENGK